MTQPKRQHPDPRSIPPLQIVHAPRLVGNVNDGAAVRISPALGLRAGLIALGTAAVIATPVILLTDHQGSNSQGSNSGPAVAPAPTPSFAGAWSPVRALPSAALVAALQPREVPIVKHAPAKVAPAPPRGPLDLSTSDLATSVEPGSIAYAPPAYLVPDLRHVAQTYQIPWRVLAAINYIETGYETALGARRAAIAAGSGPVNGHVLARSVVAAWQPSGTLVSDARKLAADGAAQSPAQAVYKYTGSSSSVQQVLTVAQQIGAEGVDTTAGVKLKLVAMENEAHLLNGLPYVWGGGHTSPAWVVGSGYDCSGFVSEVLHAAGFLDSPQTTQTLPAMAGILKGPGKYVTIYDRTIATKRVYVKKKVITHKMVNAATLGVHVVNNGKAAHSNNSVSIRLPKWVGKWETIHTTKLVSSLDNTNDDEHVIIDLDGQWWESGGSTADGGAESVHPIADPPAGYLKSFNKQLHPNGL
jgi:cell wall-associated NlpC family hydrolase